MPRKIGRGKPGKSVTRRVTKGPNKGDTVLFTANSPSAERPGKLVPRKLVKDRGPKNRTGLPRKRKRKN